MNQCRLAKLVDNALQALREVDVRLGNRAHHTRHHRIVRPLAAASHAPAADDYARMIAVNADIVALADEFFGYQNPHRLPSRSPPSSTLPHQRPPRDPPGGCRDQTSGRDRRARRDSVPPIHLTRSHFSPVRKIAKPCNIPLVLRGNLCYKHPCPWKAGELPVNIFAQDAGKALCCNQGS
jgi:hypothetical protein